MRSQHERWLASAPISPACSSRLKRSRSSEAPRHQGPLPAHARASMHSLRWSVLPRLRRTPRPPLLFTPQPRSSCLSPPTAPIEWQDKVLLAQYPVIWRRRFDREADRQCSGGVKAGQSINLQGQRGAPVSIGFTRGANLSLGAKSVPFQRLLFSSVRIATVQPAGPIIPW